MGNSESIGYVNARGREQNGDRNFQRTVRGPHDRGGNARIMQNRVVSFATSRADLLGCAFAGLVIAQTVQAQVDRLDMPLSFRHGFCFVSIAKHYVVILTAD